MKLIFCITLLGSLFFTSGYGFAQEMDLDSFLTAALANNPEIIQGKHDLNEAIQKFELIKRSPDLSINIDQSLIKSADRSQTAIVANASIIGPFNLETNLQAIWQDHCDNDSAYSFKPFAKDKYQVALTITQPLLRTKSSLPSYQNRLRFQQLITQQEIALAKIERQVLYEATQTYFKLWYNQEIIKLLNQRIKWATDQIDLLEIMLTKDMATEFDLLTSILHSKELKLELTSITRQDNLFRQSLPQLYGIDPSIKPKYEPTLWQDIQVNQFIDLESESPAYYQTKLLYDAALNDLNQVQTEQGLQGQLQFKINQEKIWQFELAISLPLFEVNTSKIKLMEAKSQVNKLKNNLNQVTFQHEHLLAKNDLLVEQAYNQLLLAQEKMSLTKNYQTNIEKRNEIGVASFDELYASIEKIQTAYVSFIDAQINYYLCLLQRELFLDK